MKELPKKKLSIENIAKQLKVSGMFKKSIHYSIYHFLLVTSKKTNTNTIATSWLILVLVSGIVKVNVMKSMHTIPMRCKMLS